MAGISEEEIIQYKKDLETYPAKKKKMLTSLKCLNILL